MPRWEPGRQKAVPKRRNRLRSKYADRFEPIAEYDVPPKIVWNRAPGGPGRLYYYSLGKNYKKIVDEVTGAVTYYKLKDNAEPPQRPGTPASAPVVATPAEKLDAEHERGPQVRYKLGCKCWFVDTDGRWYLCEVVKRTPRPAAKMTIRPITGRDATREKSWPYDGDLEFRPKSTYFARLRPLKARQP